MRAHVPGAWNMFGGMLFLMILNPNPTRSSAVKKIQRRQTISMSPSTRLTKPSLSQRPGNAHHSGNVLHRYHCLDVAHFIFYSWEFLINIDTLKKRYRLFYFVARPFYTTLVCSFLAKICWQSILLAINFINPHNEVIPVYTKFWCVNSAWKHLKGYTWGNLKQHWNFAMFIASLPKNREAKRLLNWKPCGRAHRGRLCSCWDSKIEQFSGCNGLAQWMQVTTNRPHWVQVVDPFVRFNCFQFAFICLFPQEGLCHGVRAWRGMNRKWNRPLFHYCVEHHRVSDIAVLEILLWVELQHTAQIKNNGLCRHNFSKRKPLCRSRVAMVILFPGKRTRLRLWCHVEVLQFWCFG